MCLILDIMIYICSCDDLSGPAWYYTNLCYTLIWIKNKVPLVGVGNTDIIYFPLLWYTSNVSHPYLVPIVVRNMNYIYISLSLVETDSEFGVVPFTLLISVYNMEIQDPGLTSIYISWHLPTESRHIFYHPYMEQKRGSCFNVFKPCQLY